MIGALWTGISGLAGQQTALDNESNNIANVNTIGYKSSRISFADQMYQDRIGKGTTILDAEKLYTQGNLKMTGVSYDMALSGDGFFTVSNTRGGGTAESFYTRAGNFRMGDTGTLQDAAGNDVQGWAMVSLTDGDITTTNSNVKKFTSDYTKLAASQIVKKSTSIETLTAKMTDYTTSAQADNLIAMTGAGYKTKSTKIADVEALITSYSSMLKAYSANPDVTSISSTAQKSYADFDMDTAVVDADDEIYIYINGSKYSQPFDTDEKTTLQKLTDQISNIPGITAFVGDVKESNEPSSAIAGGATGNPSNVIIIKSLVPGESVTIGDAVIVHDSVETKKTTGDEVTAVMGQGIKAVESARDALKEAVAGKQRDVWKPADLGTIATDDTLKYTLDIDGTDYSVLITEGENDVIEVPTGRYGDDTLSTTLADGNKVALLVEAINQDTTINQKVKAFSINGNLVIESLEAGKEFAGKIEFGDVSVPSTAEKSKNSDYSVNSGTSAEFIEIKTTINQSASKDSLQLRLDTLKISDSAFGDFNIDSSGLITMKQDGATFAIGQAAIALFNNNRGLEPVGDNLLSATTASGVAIYNLNNNKTADIKGKTLELSTADLSESLVNLMVFQRAFEANAKSITTADAILNTLINLKR